MTGATGHSLRILVRAYSGRADRTALDSGCHQHMEPWVEPPFADNDHGCRILRRNCLVHILPEVAACDRDHSKTAAGGDLPGPAPASTPLQSPHFLVVVKQADCAVYNVRSGL
jgi:hypothetical protein